MSVVFLKRNQVVLATTQEDKHNVKQFLDVIFNCL